MSGTPRATGPGAVQGFRKADGIHRLGLAAERPGADTVLIGTLYHSTDLGVLERSDGTAWETYFSAGLSGSVFFYRLDATTVGVSDPGAGKFRYTDATQTAATTLVFDWLTDDGFDAHILFQLFGPTTRFLVQEKAFALAYQIWEITAPATNLADYFTVPAVCVGAGGGVFTNNQRLAFIILPPAATRVV